MIVFFPEDICSEYVQLGPSIAGVLLLLMRRTGFAIIPLPARSYLKKVRGNQIKQEKRTGNKGRETCLLSLNEALEFFLLLLKRKLGLWTLTIKLPENIYKIFNKQTDINML